jgi:putative transposase
MSFLSPHETRQNRWARFRFSIVGPLLAAVPKTGELQDQLLALSKKQWTHPINGEPFSIGFTTIQRWYYKCRAQQDPVGALRTKKRSDCGRAKGLHVASKQFLQQQYREHPSWSYQLHVDNLQCFIKQHPEYGPLPAYPTIRRYMKANGMTKQKRIRKRFTEGAMQAQHRLETREVRSFEVDYVHALWHLDFHHGSLAIVDQNGVWHKPLLLAILDDRSRLIAHAQWYLDERVDTLVHGFMQALQKRGLPRALMTDNGAAMMALEFTQGLERLGILHQPTLPYSPYQNAKQETFWGQIEGRLLAMLEGEPNLGLSKLNEATLAFIELEYHHKWHSEIKTTPLKRYLEEKHLGRDCPDSTILRQLFGAQVTRKQRKSDGTLSLHGKRFEVPGAFRHVEHLVIRYARWDLSQVFLIDANNSDKMICPLYPLNKSDNASGKRRTFDSPNPSLPKLNADNLKSGIAPLLKEYMAQFAATGLPPAYLPKETIDE